VALNLSFRRREAAYLVALASLGCTALLMRVAAPPEATAYLKDGLSLSMRNYGLFLPLIAFGAVLTEVDPLAFTCSLLAFALAASVTVDRAESFFLSHDDTLGLLAAHPVGTIAMCSAIGIAMLLPLRLTKWFLPIAAATTGVALGIAVQLESPGDDYSVWFSWSGALGGTVIIFASSAAWAALKYVFRGKWFSVATRILGSWLVTASLMLTGLAFVPKRGVDNVPAARFTIPDVDMPRQP